MDVDDDLRAFGARLRELMHAKGFNQAAVARRSGIERTVVNRIVKGKLLPRPEQVAWLATVLGVQVRDLTGGAELSPDVRRAIELVREAAARVLRVEAERDAAVALANLLAIELVRERLEPERSRARPQSRARARRSQPR